MNLTTKNNRKKRIRFKIKKNSHNRPRMSIFRSDKNIYVQIIDDNIGKTLVSASTLEKKIKTKIKKTTNKEAANEVGILIAEKAKEKGIKKVIFDRGSYHYHGRVKSLAEGARKAGLEF